MADDRQRGAVVQLDVVDARRRGLRVEDSPELISTSPREDFLLLDPDEIAQAPGT